MKLMEEEEKQDTCTICLCDIPDYQKAGIDSCEHKFCFPCIKDWGMNCENTCPNCKKKFGKIIWDREIIKIDDKQLRPEEEKYDCFRCRNHILESEEAFICEVCNDVALHEGC